MIDIYSSDIQKNMIKILRKFVFKNNLLGLVNKIYYHIIIFKQIKQSNINPSRMKHRKLYENNSSFLDLSEYVLN